MAELDKEFKRRLKRLAPGVAALVALGWALDQVAFSGCFLAGLSWVRPAGVVFFLVGFALAGVSGRQLTVYGRREPALPRGTTDQLVDRGLFCWVRHPAFTGFSLILVGGGLTAKSCGFTFVSAPIGVAYLVLFTYLVEEPQLVERFGGAYRRYKARVPAFLPVPWRRCQRSSFEAKGGDDDA